jgi:LL-diaminopimelate aminotransferase
MGALLAGGEPYAMPLLPGRGFKPDLSALPQEVLEKARMLFLNYPNNPTAAVADSAYFEEVISFARKAGILVCHDHSYNEVVLEGDEPPSILQVDGAMDWAMEFGSLSKPYNMTGWRLGYAVGRSEVIEALGTVKNNIDSGVFMAVQDAGVFALDNGEPFIRKMRQVYLRRRDLVAKTLSETGFRVSPPKATFYLWVPVPEGFSSKEFCMHLLSTLGIMVTPGNGYGASGEGYFRISLTAPDDRISEAMERWKRLELKTRAVPA